MWFRLVTAFCALSSLWGMHPRISPFLGWGDVALDLQRDPRWSHGAQ